MTMSSNLYFQQYTSLTETQKRAEFIATKDTKHYKLKATLGNSRSDFVKKVSNEILGNSLIETEHFRKLYAGDF